MPTVEFFKQLGLIGFRKFLEPDFCDELCEEIKNASPQKGKYRKLCTGEDVLNEEVKKRSETMNLSDVHHRTIKEKLSTLIPEIESQYNVSLEDVQPPKFCLYETGDFYSYHIDGGDHPNMQKEVKQRKVSAIIFLNEETREPTNKRYCGGNLTFYGLVQNEIFGRFGLPLVGEKGMLITFPPTLGHEVTEVTAGERFTIATWFI